MNIRFFPSRTITFYMARMFLIRFAAVLTALTLVLLALDLLGESGNILAHPGNGDAQIWYYASLRAPQIIARFLPFSALLATLITLATLNQQSEIISMKAAGISAHQILAPLILASIGVAGLSFAFNDRVVTRSTATLDAWQAVDYGPVVVERGVKTDIWVRENDDLIHVSRVVGVRQNTRLEGVTLYDRVGGRLKAIFMAPVGIQSSGGWLLKDVSVFNVDRGQRRKIPELRFGQGVTADRFTLSEVDADELSFSALSGAINDLSEAGRPTGSLEASLWHKISGPLSAVLMPLLAGVAAFGIARSGKLFIRAVIGMGLGFLYFVGDNFALAMGNLGAYPPGLAAWAPFLLFLMIGELVLIRTEE